MREVRGDRLLLAAGLDGHEARVLEAAAHRRGPPLLGSLGNPCIVAQHGQAAYLRVCRNLHPDAVEELLDELSLVALDIPH